MSRYKTLYSNTLIFTLSNFSTKLLVFLMIPFYTRVLTTQEFGVSDLIVVLISLLLPVFSLSISEAVLRFAMENGYKKTEVFTNGLIIVVSGIILMGLLLPVFELFEITKKYKLLIYLLYITQVINQYFNQFIRGLDRIRLIGWIGALQTVFTIISNILLLFVFKLGVQGFLLSIVIANFLGEIILYFRVKLTNYIKVKSINGPLLKEMLTYSIPITPNRLSWWLNNAANKYIIADIIGTSQLGLFSAASRLPAILITFQGIFVQAWRLSAIKEFNKEDSTGFFTVIYKMYNLFMILGCAFLIAIIEKLSFLIFGDQFKSAWLYVPFLLISVVFGALIGFLEAIIMARKKTTILFVMTLIGGSINVGLNFLLIPRYGVMASTWAASLSYFTIWLLLIIYNQRNSKLHINFTKDSISYLILLIQAIAVTNLDSTPSMIASFFCILLIVANNISNIKLIIKKGAQIFIQ